MSIQMQSWYPRALNRNTKEPDRTIAGRALSFAQYWRAIDTEANG